MADKHRLRRFVTRWELPWYAFTVCLFLAALIAVVWVFPDVSNLWVSLFVLVGSFTAAVGTMITAIKQRGDDG